MRVTAIIPTLNEEKTVGNVIKGCLNYVNDVLVIDGSSKDGTCETASSCGARVVQLRQRGVGHAFQYAIATENADVLLFIDADGSHCPTDIPRLLAPIIRGGADLVVASRVTGGSDELDSDLWHLPRALGTKWIQALVNICFHVKLTDIQNGFRAVKTTVAKELGLREQGFCIDQEMAIRCLSKGFRITNIPSHEYRRCYGKSRLCLWRVAPRCLWNLAVLLMGHLFSNSTKLRLKGEFTKEKQP